MNELINHKCVYRTASYTPGLLIRLYMSTLEPYISSMWLDLSLVTQYLSLTGIILSTICQCDRDEGLNGHLYANSLTFSCISKTQNILYTLISYAITSNYIYLF